MASLSLEQVRQVAAAAAGRHRPKGFSAEVESADDGSLLVTVRYCWKDSPRFQVEAEVYMVADEVAQALRELLGVRTGEVEYLEDHICRFSVEGDNLPAPHSRNRG